MNMGVDDRYGSGLCSIRKNGTRSRG